MKAITLFVPILLAASLTTVSFATAQSFPPTPPFPPSAQGEHGMPEHGMPEHGPGRDDGPGPGPGRGRGPGMQPPIALTEAQQDKLFALRHAAEPAQREHEKALRRAHEALRELADSGSFDEAKGAALAKALGQAVAAEALDRVREQAQFLSVLTPEQRSKMQKEKMQHGPGEHRPGQQP